MQKTNIYIAKRQTLMDHVDCLKQQRSSIAKGQTNVAIVAPLATKKF